jgi:signal peptide peptidase SppA
MHEHLSRLAGRPVLLDPVRGKAELQFLLAAAPPPSRPQAMDDDEDDRPRCSTIAMPALLERGGFAQLGPVIDGVAVIEAGGILVNRLGYIGRHGRFTGYDGMAAQLRAARFDRTVRTVAFDIDTPGGMVDGCFPLAEEIRATAAEKPVVAIVDGMACSAGYALASACSYITASETAILGSIGVVQLHLDVSKALADFGFAVTMIYAGKHKVDGNPFEKLPEAVRAAMQAEIDAIYGGFVRHVAAMRGLEEDAVRATEADTYLAPEAVRRGLADQVLAPRASLAELVAAARAAAATL